MKHVLAPIVLLVCAGATPARSADAPLTPTEQAAGWQHLFDGSTTSAFRGYKQPGFPGKGWSVRDGVLHHAAGGGGGDLITTEQFTDFELSLDFKCAPGANSGIMYRVTETADATYFTGPEFQILDDEKHKDGMNAKHSVGALYDLIAPPADKPAAPADRWHNARVRIKNGVLTHWLNGFKTAECRIDDDNWKQLIAGSKFKAWSGFGVQPRGHIAIQDHGDEVWYRDIKIRDLSEPLPDERLLFNGDDTTGWTAPEGAGSTGSWSVRGRVLACSGEPAGYIRTTERYTNFILRFDWRFEEGKAGNSGCLVRVQEPDKVWPKSIEAQLASGSAGDFWNIDEFSMTTDPQRTKGRNTRRTTTNERPVGEWNDYEIIADGGTVVLKVNGVEVNRATDCAAIPGFIAFQSEGGAINFRNIRIVPLND